ncbi:MAG: hypothetical protein GXP55_04905 [Deltaproteobacteria bacterium]|nr:hypothetical protein [Deltaproteobacteria bacterium]
MNTRNKAGLVAVALITSVWAQPHVRAYDSLCRVPSTPTSSTVAGLGLGAGNEDNCPPGPAAAQARFRIQQQAAGSAPALDEHRQILEDAMRAAGLPAAALATIELPVYTSSDDVVSVTHWFRADETVPSVMPVTVDTATRVRTRRYTVDELAQLPDFSYSLWDWAGGNETCPLGNGADPIACHTFTTHTGAVNSNHFVPQADHFYDRLHLMALARAAKCADMHGRIGAAHAREFEDYIKQCEYEALTIEAEAQHFLQDAWSAGHMWERWGSTDLEDFPTFDFSYALPPEDQKLIIADTVAAMSGLIHGAEALAGTCDRMCCPDGNTRFILGGGSSEPMAGDIHLRATDGIPGVLDGSDYAVQADHLTRCTASSVRAVYMALSPAGMDPMLGAASAPSYTAIPADQVAAFCHGGRATNKAMLDAMGIDFSAFGSRFQVSFEGAVRVGRYLVRTATRGGSVLLPDTGIDRMSRDLVRIYHAAKASALDDPNGTNIAALRDAANQPLLLLGVSPNSAYPRADHTAGYEDPPLPWAEGGDPKAAVLARAYNMAHASEWCSTMTAEMLDSLRSRAVRARSRESLCDRLPGPGREGCDELRICVAFAVRHLRTGSDACDPGQQPICNYLKPESAFIYQSVSGTSPTSAQLMTAAKDWCLRPMSDTAATASTEMCTADPCADQTACDSCNATLGCGWCGGTGECMSVSRSDSCSTGFDSSSSACVDCSGFTDCVSCADRGFCGWCPGMGCLNDAASGNGATCTGGGYISPTGAACGG